MDDSVAQKQKSTVLDLVVLGYSFLSLMYALLRRDSRPKFIWLVAWPHAEFVLVESVVVSCIPAQRPGEDIRQAVLARSWLFVLHA